MELIDNGNGTFYRISKSGKRYKVCECGKQRSFCKEHGSGGALCECGKQRSFCKEHGGSALCECGKQRSFCKEHGGSALCECGKRRSQCKEHGGGAFCGCGKQRSFCKEHGGSALCECGKQLSWCWTHYRCPCGLKNDTCQMKHKNNFCTLCKEQLLSKSRLRTEDLEKRLCKRCEDDAYGKLLIRIEHEYIEKLESWGYFPSVHDEIIRDGECNIITEHGNNEKLNKKRVDLFFRTGVMSPYHVLLEIDENSHSGYDISCEYKRLQDIFDQVTANLGFPKPIIVIRFNPFSKNVDLDDMVRTALSKAFAGQYKKVDDDRGFEVVELIGYSKKRTLVYERSEITKKKKI